MNFSFLTCDVLRSRIRTDVVMSSLVPKTAILGLYKQLMRYGQTLEFTDKAYFSREIRRKFEKPRATQEDVDFAVRKGRKLLETQRLV